MDPISIVSICGAALNAAGTVAWKFQQFISSTNRIDRTIGEMGRETRTIELSLTSIRNMLSSKSFALSEARLTASNDDASEGIELREAMLGSLTDCQVRREER